MFRKVAIKILEKTLQSATVYTDVSGQQTFQLKCAKPFMDALQFAVTDIKRNAWIPIEERLPDEGKTVLVSMCAEPEKCLGARVEMDCYLPCDRKYWESGKVLAWMPLPTAFERGDIDGCDKVQ